MAELHFLNMLPVAEITADKGFSIEVFAVVPSALTKVKVKVTEPCP